VRDVLRKIETELKGETMTGVLALVSPEFFDKLIGHAKVEDAYKYYSSTGAQPLREDTRRASPSPASCSRSTTPPSRSRPARPRR
jgi:hypothetical protein